MAGKQDRGGCKVRGVSPRRSIQERSEERSPIVADCRAISSHFCDPFSVAIASRRLVGKCA